MIKLYEYLINKQTKEKQNNEIYFVLDCNIDKSPKCYIVKKYFESEKLIGVENSLCSLKFNKNKTGEFYSYPYIGSIKDKRSDTYLFTKEIGIQVLKNIKLKSHSEETQQEILNDLINDNIE